MGWQIAFSLLMHFGSSSILSIESCCSAYQPHLLTWRSMCVSLQCFSFRDCIQDHLSEMQLTDDKTTSAGTVQRLLKVHIQGLIRTGEIGGSIQ